LVSVGKEGRGKKWLDFFYAESTTAVVLRERDSYSSYKQNHKPVWLGRKGGTGKTECGEPLKGKR